MARSFGTWTQSGGVKRDMSSLFVHSESGTGRPGAATEFAEVLFFGRYDTFARHCPSVRTPYRIAYYFEGRTT